jgi:hypothetical protein
MVTDIDGDKSDCPICRRGMRYTLSGRVFLRIADLLVTFATWIAARGIRRGLPYGGYWRPDGE